MRYKNTRYKGFSVIFLVLAILCINSISAAEWDNCGTYDEETRTMTVKNWMCVGATIAEITLLSDEHVYVMPGSNREVARFYIESQIPYVAVFNRMNFYNLHAGGEEFDRGFTYKYLTYEEVEVPNYVTTCIQNVSGEFCSSEVDGTRIEQKEVWNNFDSALGLIKGNYTIGIFTNVLPGDYVDWIPTLFGVEIDEWATWSDAFYEGLVVYYPLNESAGATAEDVSNNPRNMDGLRINSRDQDWVDGKIGNGLYFKGGAPGVVSMQQLNSSSEVNITGNFSRSVFLWVNWSGQGTSQGLAGFGEPLDNKESSLLMYNNNIAFGDYNFYCSADALNNRIFDFVGYVYNGSTVTVYHNDTLVTTCHHTTNNMNDNVLVVGNRTGAISWLFNGTIDEVAVWNRTLSASEISDLWNNGDGLTYGQTIVAPVVTQNFPDTEYYSSQANVDFNCSATHESNVTNLTLVIDDSIANTYINDATPLYIDFNVTKTLTEGFHNWSCQASDNSTVSLQGDTITRNVTVDLTDPSVSILSPIGQIDTHVIGDNLYLNWTISDTNLDSCWYDYNSANTSVTCADNNVTFATIAGKQTIIMWANDSSGRETSDSSSWTYGFVENSATFNTFTNETAREVFTLNMTTNLNVLSISSVLQYNGTNYTSSSVCSGSECNLTNIIDVPLIVGEEQNRSFNWHVTIYNGTDTTTATTSLNYQNSTKIRLVECGGTYANITMNLTAWNEGNSSSVNPFSLEGSMNVWKGMGTVTRNYTFSNVSNYEHHLCIDSPGQFYFDGVFEYDGAEKLNQTFVPRYYYFDNYSINTVIQHVELQLLESSDSTTFIQRVLENSQGVSGAYIYTYRYFPGTNEWKISQISQTNEDGETLGFYEAETALYRHTITLDGIVRVNETSGQKMIPADTPYTIEWNIGTGVGIPYQIYDNELNLDKSLSFNSDTNMVIFSYNDTNITFSQGRLKVVQEKYATDDVLIYNSTKTLSSANIYGNMSNYTSGTFIATAYITRNGEEILVDQINFAIGAGRETFGKTGLVIGFFIILTAAMAFLWHPLIGLWAVTIVTTLVNLIGLISFSRLYLLGMFVLATIISILMKD